MSTSAASIADVSVSMPSWAEIVKVLTLQAGFNSTVVVLGTTFLGIAAGVVGTFSVLRKRALIGDALAHSTLPGLAAAYILAVALGWSARSLPLLLFGATVSGALGVLAVQFLVRRTRLSEDTAIGAVLSVFFGAGIVLLSVIQSLRTGSEGGLHHFIYGQTAALGFNDVILTFSMALLVCLAALGLIKEFRLVCFDSDFAAAQGWPVSRIDLLMMSLVVAVTVIGLQAVGLLLIVALLVVPAAAARFWTERLSRMVLISGLLGGLSGYVGSVASALLPRLPAGAVIVLVAGALFFFSFIFAPCRGVLAANLRMFRWRLKVGEEHLLRSIFEELDHDAASSSNTRALSLKLLTLIKGWSFVTRWYLLFRLSRSGLIDLDLGAATLALTAQGQREAARLTRNHRLWEEYLFTHADLAATHVDRSADIVEHVLDERLLSELEASLTARGKLPTELSTPASIHPLARA